jgi:hypothetical protein
MSKYLILYSSCCDPLIITAKNQTDLIEKTIEDAKSNELPVEEAIIFELDLAKALEVKLAHTLVKTTRKEIPDGC